MGKDKVNKQLTAVLRQLEKDPGGSCERYIDPARIKTPEQRAKEMEEEKIAERNSVNCGTKISSYYGSHLFF